MSDSKIKLEPGWKQRLTPILTAPQMVALRDFLIHEKRTGKIIYPKSSEIFAAFDATPFEQVKVVILGQDPYHGSGQAHGLSFSVQPGIKPPPSLQNIFNELERDLGLARPDHGCLTPWATQGVLLLNTVLTVEHGIAASHQGKGWETLTDAVIDALNQERQDLVFLLWGSPAQAKGRIVDSKKHLVLRAPHPSPLSAHRGFIGCGHFSRTNQWLVEHQLTPINWQLPACSML
jgi:uracil-DNA glycosylase